ncbi:MAG: mechanosensitive ion channel family protein [Gammaproteobacteria bacterium]|nr:MAG: mechanosensitive ion channel family protein [Gammaproteobacteria bacterium]
MKELLELYNPITGDEAWIFHVFLVVIVVLLFNFFLGIFLKRIKIKLEATKNLWDDAFINALAKPARLLVWIVGLTFAAEIAADKSDATVFEMIDPIREIGVITAITWFLVRFINGIEKSIVTSHPSVDRATSDAISRLIRIAIIITAVLVTLQTLGFSISGVLAFGGIGGIAVGFASKDLLSNFFGGLMIFLDRPFATGDWIRSPDRDIEGTVERIGWRLTVIRTFDKRPLYIPNAIFNTISVQNPSRMSHRRIYETIGIRYDDASKMEDIVNDVKAMLKKHPEIDPLQTLMVNFNSFAPSSLDFFVYTFTRTTVWEEYHEVKQDVLLKINRIIEAHGAEVAFPTSTLHVPDILEMQPPAEKSA